MAHCPKSVAKSLIVRCFREVGGAFLVFSQCLGEINQNQAMISPCLLKLFHVSFSSTWNDVQDRHPTMLTQH